MQINAPPIPNLTVPAAVAPQVVRNYVQPPAAPKISPRAIDAGEQGHKGTATGSATQKQGAVVRATSGRTPPRGSHVDVLV